MNKEQRDTMRNSVLNYLGNKETFVFDPFSENYLVSNLGRVLNIKTNRYLKGSVNDTGYISVKIYHKDRKETIQLHRLVARTFLNMTEYEVNHINRIKTDNRLINLELVTRQENLKHAKDNNAYVGKKGELSPSFKFTNDIVRDMIFMKNSGFKLKDIANKYKTSMSYTCTLIKQRGL